MRIFLKTYLIILLCLSGALAARGQQWRQHATFDGNIHSLIDTPDRLYILSYNQPVYDNTPGFIDRTLSLFCYDKEGEELTFLNRSNRLSGNVLQAAAYNPQGKYLLAVYDDGDIDILHDDGRTVNVPGFRLSDASFSRKVNGISFDSASGLAYIGTDFGYIAVNCAKGEVSHTRKLGVAARRALMFKNKLFVLTDSNLLCGAPAAMSASDMEVFTDLPALRDVAVAGDRLYIWNGSPADGHIWWVENPEIKVNNHVLAMPVLGIDVVASALRVIGNDEIVSFDAASHEMTRTPRPAEDSGKAAASVDGRRFWIDNGRKGISMKQVADGTWTTRIEKLFPNSSAAFRSDWLTWHKDYGMLVRNHGNSLIFTSLGAPIPDLISSLRNMEWKHLSNVYSNNPTDALDVWNPRGVLVDPDRSNLIYCGSYLFGLMRLDTSDPSKSLRVTRANDPYAGATGVSAIEPVDSEMENLCCYIPGGFDASGRLWMGNFSLARQKTGGGLDLRYWTADDRAAINGVQSLRPLKSITLDKIKGSASAIVKPLTSTKARNLIVVAAADGHENLSIFDHNGTPDVKGDDKFYNFGKIYDQDGLPIDTRYVYCVFEDPSTGNVWVGNDNGVYWFDPAEAVKNPGRVNRVKVARNDGTNLADYLLNAVSVTAMAIDRDGFRWFATDGGGLVCTSASGNEIRKTYTRENSMLPDNTVYSICYNPDNNSIMASTASGLAELYLSSAPGSSDSGDAIKAYPNPVRPEYYGFVTIEGLPDGAVVKVTDSMGNLVRELDTATGGETRWDLTNSSNRRVPAGVYRILASGGADGEAYSASTKVLVVK